MKTANPKNKPAATEDTTVPCVCSACRKAVFLSMERIDRAQIGMFTHTSCPKGDSNYLIPMHGIGAHRDKTLRAPDKAGNWLFTEFWPENEDEPQPVAKLVVVDETLSAGRLCKELQMGGHAQCGFDDWSGMWLHVNP